MSLSLFDTPTSETKKTPIETFNAQALAAIEGLDYCPNFLTVEEHDKLLAAVDAAPWLADLKRRVQHYGYKYDYKARAIDHTMHLGALPQWVQPLAQRLAEEKLMPKVPDQLIVNEYQPGQGIADHVDCEPCFGDTIISITLHAGCIMNFKSKKRRSEKYAVYLEPRSLVVLKGAARYDWTHGINPNKSDTIPAQGRVPRKRRVSLTFRKVILR